MTRKNCIKPVTAAIGAALAGSLSAVNVANAAENPFGASQLERGHMVLASSHEAENKKKEGKCGEGKCGEGKGKAESAEAESDDGGKKQEGKCGEGKCGEGKEKKEGKCGEGKCGGKT